MNILLTNDDGVFAPGIAALYKELVKFGNVTVVAPADSQSGASHSITFAEPLVCQPVELVGLFEGYSVCGSPADCVKLAYLQLHEGPIDLVVAGMNEGANVGISVYYSGTVAAAMEGAFLRIPSVAMSLAAEKDMDFQLGAKYCVDVLEKLKPYEAGYVTNVNIPRLSQGRPKGIRVVQQSTEGFEEEYLPRTDEAGQTVFQLAGGMHRHEDDATDTVSLSEGYITVTALIPDMTHHAKTEELREKLSDKSEKSPR